MLDLGFVRQNFEHVEQKLAQRSMSGALDNFRDVDTRRRKLLTEVEALKARRNLASEEIGRLKKQGIEAEDRILEMRQVSDEIKRFDEEVGALDDELQQILTNIPNVPHPSVPVGRSSEENQEVRRWGEPPRFSFEPRAHWDIGEALGILDLARASKITGARFAVYWDLGAKLERALANFMLDVHGREHGYREVLPPAIVNSASLLGTGQLPKFAEDLFRLQGTDLWLIPTAEVPVTNLFRDEVLDAANLPISLTAYTPCFRSEAGSYGKDTRGIVRHHQFQKVEMVKFVHPSTSYDELEKLTGHAEDLLQRLGLPYRVVNLCTGDLGFSAAKTYDLEVWLPGQRVYREISSCSNFESFQARRANIRFRMGGKGKSDFVHTLNGSGLPTGRTWMAIVENYQQEDGSVLIPEVLRGYLGGAERITAAGQLVPK
jgi:seryl-tRNA synthetase